MSELCICECKLDRVIYRRRRDTKPIAPRPSRANEDGSGTAGAPPIKKLKFLAVLPGKLTVVPLNERRPPPAFWPSKIWRFPPVGMRKKPRLSLELTVNGFSRFNLRKLPLALRGGIVKVSLASTLKPAPVLVAKFAAVASEPVNPLAVPSKNTRSKEVEALAPRSKTRF